MTHRRNLLAVLAIGPAAACQSTAVVRPSAQLAGTWRLVAAERQTADGTRVPDYGANPSGLLLIGEDGRYSLQVFSAERGNFASGDKSTGTDAEMRAAVLGASTHFGSLSVDWASRTLTFSIDDALFPNWRGQVQRRSFDLQGNVLTYRVPPRADGNVPISIWRREPA